jgi:hypothetical protein
VSKLNPLLAEVTLQGAVVLDGLGFASQAHVKEVVMRECPEGGAFEVFLDPMLLWCCNPGYSLVTNWEEMTRAMDEDYSATARKVVASYYQTHFWWYAEGKHVVAGKVMAAFKDADKWNGLSGMDGWCHEIAPPQRRLPRCGCPTSCHQTADLLLWRSR